MAAERAVNEKAYLVGEKGLDASRISVYTGTAGTNTAATTLIPAGATLNTTGLTPVMFRGQGDSAHCSCAPPQEVNTLLLEKGHLEVLPAGLCISCEPDILCVVHVLYLLEHSWFLQECAQPEFGLAL